MKLVGFLPDHVSGRIVITTNNQHAIVTARFSAPDFRGGTPHHLRVMPNARKIAHANRRTIVG